MLPVWTIVYFNVENRPRRSWPLQRCLMVKIMQTFLDVVSKTGSFRMDEPDIEQWGRNPELMKKHGMVWVEARPYVLVDALKEAAKVNGVKPVRLPGFWVGKRDSAGFVGQRAGPDEKVIYHLFGGGHIMSNGSPKGVAQVLCKDFLKHFHCFERVFLIDHRRAQGPPLEPKNAFPSAVIDAISGYDYLVKDLGFKPENILVTGDSAGASLAIQLVRALRDHPSLNMGIPGGVMPISPYVDAGKSNFGPHSSLLTNWDSDLVHFILGIYPVQAYLGSLPMSEASTNPWIAPVSLRLSTPYGHFKDFPPTYLIVGDAEMFLDENRLLRDRIIQDTDASRVTYREVIDGTHPSTMAMGHPAELEETLRLMAIWVSEVFDK
ncbi:alpha/beta-hydrolase [Trametopsis cervina]|nr:alpha/beta-hydrolase [Trametopsis cervina]